jgi:hypothetical protein
MQSVMRSSPARRRDAIDLLNSVTTGVALTGAMATVGFAALAAATFRGNATPDAAPAAVVDDGSARTGDDDGLYLFDPGTSGRAFSGGLSGGSSGLSGASGPAQVTTGGS